jgi:hypothetical protein
MIMPLVDQVNGNGLKDAGKNKNDPEYDIHAPAKVVKKEDQRDVVSDTWLTLLCFNVVLTARWL